jgi:hypothetical protein
VVTAAHGVPWAILFFSPSEHPLDRTKSSRKEAACPLPPPCPVGIGTFPWRWRPAPCPEEPPVVSDLFPCSPSVSLLYLYPSRPARSVGIRPRRQDLWSCCGERRERRRPGKISGYGAAASYSVRRVCTSCCLLQILVSFVCLVSPSPTSSEFLVVVHPLRSCLIQS